MQIQNAKYEVTAVDPGQYPKRDLPEIALVGRSNVGKSSIINALTGQKNLARVASAPGKTQEINFYNVDNTLYFVDLPGYGYARVSKSKKDFWGWMIETYLNSRNQLMLILMLVDIRHAPSGDDQMMYEWIGNQDRKSLVLASKLDKVLRSQVANRLQDIRTTLGMNETEIIIPFSAVTKQGREEVWRIINKII